MQADEPGPDPSPPPTSASVNATPSAAPAPRAGERWSAAATWTQALTAALLTGLLSWGVGEAMYNHFQPSEAAASQYNRSAALNRETAQANGYNGAVVFGSLGGLLGLGLGLAGGLARRAAVWATLAALLGLTLGVVAGSIPSLWVMPWHWYHRSDEPYPISLVTPMLIHGALWCALGASAGVAYAFGRRGPNPRRLLVSAIGGFVGAVIGTVIYELTGALAFPLSRTTDPFAGTPVTRLLEFLCVTIFVTLAVVTVYHPRTRRGKPSLVAAPLE